MPQGNVKVLFVNQPKQPGWAGSIKVQFVDTQAVAYINVHEELLSQFTAGGVYSIFYKERMNKAGKPVKDFQEFVSMTSGPPQTTAPKPAGQQPPTAPQKPGNGHYAPKPSQEHGMFVMGAVGRAMGSGKFTPDDIFALTVAASAAWRHVMEGVPLEPKQIVIPADMQILGGPIDDEPPPNDSPF